MRTGVRVAAVVWLALLVPAARAADKAPDKAAIQQAVDQAVQYLKNLQQPDGSWRYSTPEYELGSTALCGLALLECGVPAKDPVIQGAAKYVREKGAASAKTYSLSLAIMFLDVLGDPADEGLIDSMGVRLLGGQNLNSGGWTYECPPPSEAEVRRLQQHELVAKPPPAPDQAGRRGVEDLPPSIQQELQRVLKIQQQQAGVEMGAYGTGDNSNTQFAILALWIAHRRGLPVDVAMVRAAARFRRSQSAADGGWAYTPGSSPADNTASASTPAMTCSGLITLALSHGTTLEAAGQRAPGADPSKDLAVRKGLLGLGSCVGKPFEAVSAVDRGNPGRGYYFLFSLERVGVAYGLDTIGDKDWYAWGTDILLKNQKPDGSWVGQYGEAGVDTCFALLFLRKANLTQDLTTTLHGRVRDPGHELRSVDLNNLNKGAPPKETRPAAEPAADAEVGRLSDELVKAGAGRQEQVLQKLRDGKGAVYTDALAHAIHRLDGPTKGQARDALADRLTRMKKETLDDKLKDDDLEIRRAAALACAMKDEKVHVPRLIELLQDPEADVARAAHAALKSLTNQDFGPARDAGKEDVARAAAAWKDWWAKNGGT
jgi:hypothetical protein